jgi:hypothetical protein
MIDSKVEEIINKPRKLWALVFTRGARRPLNAKLPRPGKPWCVAEFHYLLFGIAS